MKTIKPACSAPSRNEPCASPHRRIERPSGFRLARLFGAIVALAAAPLAPAATNNLVAALQQGLFDEEANHDFAGAIKYYQSVVDRFEEDRKLAATALFRLGECYRKQGNTNEANAQYERVLREFPDQVQFAALSRAYLDAAGQPGEAVGAGPRPATSAEAEEVARITAMIKDSPDLINARDPGTGQTPLQKAAGQGQLVVAQFLLANGADVNARNPRSADRTALHFAAEAGHKAVVELLISNKANVKAADRNGFTALHLAVEHGFRGVIETLLAHGAEVNAATSTQATPLHFAAANGFKAIVEVLLARGADVNSLSSQVHATGSQSFSGTPLHIAAARGDDSLAGLLLTNHASVNALDGEGLTPLAIAASRESLSMAALLVAHGADVNARKPGPTVPGATPLIYAVFSGRKEIAALLLKSHADPNATCDSPAGAGVPNWDTKALTPLLIAARRGDTEMVKLLLEAGADANQKDANGDTPIHESVGPTSTTALSMLTALLEHGADVNARNQQGSTVLMRAAAWRRSDLVSVLLAHKPEVNAQDPAGNTALHSLASGLNQTWQSYPGLPFQVYLNSDGLAVLEALIAAGADVNLRNRDGRTPLNCIPSQPPGTPENSLLTKFVETLRRSGALSELPDSSTIRLTRAGSGYSYVVFRSQTNHLNQFTVLEAIANFYLDGEGAARQFIPGTLPGMGPYQSGQGPSVPPLMSVRLGQGPSVPPLRFPDFSRVKILRPVPGQLTERKTIQVNLLTPADSFDGSKDVALEFGDVVEVPEREHPLSESPVGLAATQANDLLKCLQRKVTIRVKGQPMDLDLDGGHSTCYLSKALGLPAVQSFLRSSSDLSHLAVKRAATAGGKALSIPADVVPFWNNRSPLNDDLWLRNGDVIEVPDKP